MGECGSEKEPRGGGFSVRPKAKDPDGRPLSPVLFGMEKRSTYAIVFVERCARLGRDGCPLLMV